VTCHKGLFSDKIREFLLEDLGMGDITTASLIEESLVAEGTIICKEDGVIAGVEEASEIFEALGCSTDALVKDGDSVSSGTSVLIVRGLARAVLEGERTALNILMRMSGIATSTKLALSEARKVNPVVRVSATRKTAPGLRYFDKKAVELGGGDTHRLRLDDCVLIKNNHLILFGLVTDAIKAARERVSFTKKIEVEIETADQAVEAAQAGADIIMLDNIKPEDISRVVNSLERKGLRKKVLLEASGEITQGNIKKYASVGVDVISMGSLTHSAKALDLNMTITST
jgi:nicotinate-nucleotide pyrophosphorylase (carboxylating)